MKSITIKVASGSTEEIAVVGNYVRIKTASVAVRIRDMHSDVDATIEQGDALNLKPFTRLRVSHSDAADQSITLLIGDGTSADSAKVGGSVAVSGDVSTLIKAGTTYGKNTSTIGVVGGSVRGIPPTQRRYWFMQNMGATTLFVMPSSVPALNTGIKLLPGDSFVWENWVPQETIYAISDAAGGLLSFIEGT